MYRLFHVRTDRVARLLPAASLLGLLCLSPAAAGDAAKKIAGKTLTILRDKEEDAAKKITGKTLSILRDKENVIVKQGDQLVLRYRYRGVPKKPYVAEMTSPGGVNILRDAPADHLHHHGLMFAWAVDDVDFWGEAENAGLQVHQAWKDLRVSPRPGTEEAVLDERLVWQTPDGKVLLEEQRRLTIPAAAKGRPRVLVWQAEFTPGKQAAAARTIFGSKYHGLGMRFIKPMDTEGLHFNAVGGEKVAETNGKRAAWSAYTAQLNPGKKVTVAMFSEPANPRHPCEWFTMGEKDAFAYLSGTLGVGTEALKLEPAGRLSVCFGVAIFEGPVDTARVKREYARFTMWAERNPL